MPFKSCFYQFILAKAWSSRANAETTTLIYTLAAISAGKSHLEQVDTNEHTFIDLAINSSAQ